MSTLEGTPRGEPGAEWPVAIPTSDDGDLPGMLLVPPEPHGLVIFVHGWDSTRESRGNRAVAKHLDQAGFATLQFDPPAPRTEANGHGAHHVGLLTGRLLGATAWARRVPQLQGLPLGYFGVSTGAAAALRAAAALGTDVAAVVSAAGRPDLAEDALPDVAAPTLLISGGDDWNVLGFNDVAAAQLGGAADLAVIPHAGRLFEEPGAVEEVARLTAGWFSRHVGTAATRAPGHVG